MGGGGGGGELRLHTYLGLTRSFRIRSNQISWLSGVKFRENEITGAGRSAFSTPREYFNNNNFSDFTHILFYIIFSISSCHLLLKGKD